MCPSEEEWGSGQPPGRSACRPRDFLESGQVPGPAGRSEQPRAGHGGAPSARPAFGRGGVGRAPGRKRWAQAGDIAGVGRQSAARCGGVGGEARWVARPAGPPEAKGEGSPCPLAATCSIPGSNLHPSCCPCPAASWEGAFYPSFQCDGGRSPWAGAPPSPGGAVWGGGREGGE